MFYDSRAAEVNGVSAGTVCSFGVKLWALGHRVSERQAQKDAAQR